MQLLIIIKAFQAVNVQRLKLSEREVVTRRSGQSSRWPTQHCQMALGLMFQTIKNIKGGSSKLHDSYFVLGQSSINGYLVLFRKVKVILVNCIILYKNAFHTECFI